MTQAPATLFEFDNTFVRDLAGLYEGWGASRFPEPRLVALNERLAAELGVDAAQLRTPAGVGMLVANPVPFGAAPVAQVYAGHQFGPMLREFVMAEACTRSATRRCCVGWPTT